jgi:hypothetical protein
MWSMIPFARVVLPVLVPPTTRMLRRSATAVLARQLPEAEKEEAAAFERAKPAAAVELATRQERGSLAREILAERRQEQDQARERQREQSRDRDHGMER